MIPDLLTLLAGAIILFLIITTGILIHNRRFLIPLPGSRDDHSGRTENDVQSIELVSILIPARNEERTISRCVEQACRQSHPAVEVIVLDDQSTDQTPEKLGALTRQLPDRLRGIRGKPLPDGWLGKPWACQQLYEASKGDVLLFIDADVSLLPGTAANTLEGLNRYKLDMLTVWPIQTLNSFWERVIIPLIYHGLFTLLPSLYVYQKPVWMPSTLYDRTSVLFAAACGQFIAFKREAYQTIGGHHAVKSKVVEDVALARLVKSKKLDMRMFHGDGSASCRMYRNESEIFEGLRKNFLAGFDYRWSLFWGTGIVMTASYLLPFVLIPAAYVFSNFPVLILSLLAVVFMLVQRYLIARWYRMDVRFILTHPLGLLWFIRLAFRVSADRLTGRLPLWKGRPVQ